MTRRNPSGSKRLPISRPTEVLHVFDEDELAAYVLSQGFRVEPYRGRLWRTGAAPSPIAKFDWTPLLRWNPVPRDEAGYPRRSGLTFRCLADEPVATTFPFVVFRDVPGYDEYGMSNGQAWHVRRALEQFECAVLSGPDLLLEQGWSVAQPAAAISGMRLAVDENSYRSEVSAAFNGTPPVVWAALAEGRLAGYAVTYATGSEAMLEKVYIGPQYRQTGVGPALHWSVLSGWGQTPDVQNVWTGGTLPHRGVDHFKLSLVGRRI